MTVEMDTSFCFRPDRFWTGKTQINPSKPIPMAGYSGPVRLSNPGVLRLEANWMVFKAEDGGIVVVLSVDALFSSVAFEKGLQHGLSQNGFTVNAIWCVASHTHFAPQLDPGKPLLGTIDLSHMQSVVDRIVKSIVGTMLSPAISVKKVLHGRADCQGSVYRRRFGAKLVRSFPFLKLGTIMAPAPRVKIPKNLRLWGFVDEAGEVISWIAHWPCHTVAATPFDQMSPTHVGPLRECLRKLDKNGTTPVIYLPGCCGDIRPDIRAERFSLRGMIPVPFQLAFKRATPAAVKSFECQVRRATRQALNNTVSMEIGKQGRYTSAEKDIIRSCTLSVKRLVLGPVTLIGINAETCFGWVERLGFKNESAHEAVTGYVSSVFGYLPTPDQIPNGGYEVDGFVRAFEFKGNWKSEPKIENLVKSVVSATEF